MRDCAGQHVFAVAMIETNARVNLEPLDDDVDRAREKVRERRPGTS
jgi:hypothetical protein